MSSSNAALPAIRRLFEIFDTHDLSVIPSCVTEDFVDHGSPVALPPGPRGYAAILGFVTGVLDIRYEVQDMFWTEDRIVIRAVAHGRGVAAVHGAEVAGRPYDMDALHVFRTDGELLAEHWGVRDELGVLVQLGVLPAPEVRLPDAA